MFTRAYQVVLFENEGQLGIHSHTIESFDNGASTPVETGFIVYNEPCWPNLVAMFDHLGAPTNDSNTGRVVSLGSAR